MMQMMSAAWVLETCGLLLHHCVVFAHPLSLIHELLRLGIDPCVCVCVYARVCIAHVGLPVCTYVCFL